MAHLSELDFSDLYVCLDQEGGESVPSRYNPAQRKEGRTPGCLRVPEIFEKEIDISLRGLVVRQERDTFSIDIDDMRLRGSRISLMGDQRWVALRRFPLDAPDLNNLNFPPSVVEEFRQWGDRRGLILIGGETGAGKTTTAIALLTDYLKHYGKVAFTIEDPAEYFLQGEYGERGEGFCFQTEVHDDSGWEAMLKEAFRWKPRYIFVGEIRTAAAAKWVLRAGTSGHLVICTVHGGSIEATISSLIQIAQSELGETAKTQLAEGLCAVVYQELVRGRPKVKILTTDPNSVGMDKVKSIIREGKLEALAQQIDDQNRKRGLLAESEKRPVNGNNMPPRTAPIPASARPPSNSVQPPPRPAKPVKGGKSDESEESGGGGSGKKRFGLF